MHRLRFILRAKDHGFTLREIKVILDIHDSHTATRADVRGVIECKIAAVETQIRQLQEYEGALERLRGLCEGDGPRPSARSSRHCRERRSEMCGRSSCQ